MSPGQYSTTLLSRQDISPSLSVFHIEKPLNFSYQAGQYILLTLPELEKSDSTQASRSMSLASAPHEPNLILLMRRSDSLFKKTLFAQKAGHPLKITGPLGHLTLDPDDQRPLVFIAGGVGITPFRSIIFDQKKKGFSRPITLFYSSRNSQESAFQKDIVTIKNPSFSYIPTITRPDPAWTGQKGRIDRHLLLKYLKNPQDYSFYLVGLPGMVLDLKETLASLSVPMSKIKTEAFTGY